MHKHYIIHVHLGYVLQSGSVISCFSKSHCFHGCLPTFLTQGVDEQHNFLSHYLACVFLIMAHSDDAVVNALTFVMYLALPHALHDLKHKYPSVI